MFTEDTTITGLTQELQTVLRAMSPVHRRAVLKALNVEFVGLTSSVLSSEKVYEIFTRHGFTVKEGQCDLKTYVYDAAHALAVEVQRLVGYEPESPKENVVLESSNLKQEKDWTLDIDWEQGDKIHDWRNRVHDAVRREWSNMTQAQRRGIIFMAENLRHQDRSYMRC